MIPTYDSEYYEPYVYLGKKTASLKFVKFIRRQEDKREDSLKDTHVKIRVNASLSERGETIMTFHGVASRRSRRAFDTLDAPGEL